MRPHALQGLSPARLEAALTAAGPGRTIPLADGTRTGNFTATVPGTTGGVVSGNTFDGRCCRWPATTTRGST